MTLILGKSTWATIRSMYSRLISYRHNDTTLHQKWYFYSMKILHPPLNHVLIPVPWLNQDFDSSPGLRALFQRVAYSVLIWLQEPKVVVRQLLETLFDSFTWSLMGFIVPSLHCLAVFGPLLSSRHSVMYQCPFWLCFTEFKSMFFSKTLLLQQPCYHAFSQTQ